uniref:Venom peptide Tba9.5 n=1 Tax=Turris babylonia TaxID=439604 RepID=A0A976LYA8_9CAEN|nr:venom peptide precursor Tba9.5 [Turris babylonia]
MKFHLLTLTLFLTAVMSIGATPIILVKNERSAMNPLMKMIRQNNCGCSNRNAGYPCPESSNECSGGVCSLAHTCEL